MSTLVMGFIALVILPAWILSMVIKYLVREPAECAFRDDHAVFTLSMKGAPGDDKEGVKKSM